MNNPTIGTITELGEVRALFENRVNEYHVAINRYVWFVLGDQAYAYNPFKQVCYLKASDAFANNSKTAPLAACPF